MGANKSAENTPYFQPNVSTKAQKFGILEKSSLSVSVVGGEKKYAHTYEHPIHHNAKNIFTEPNSICQIHLKSDII